MIGEELRLGELRGDGKGLHCVVREDPERLQDVVVGQQPVARLVGPEHAADFVVGAVEGHDEPMMVPGEGPFPVQDGLVDDLLPPDPALGLLGRNEIAARDLELGVEEPCDDGAARDRPSPRRPRASRPRPPDRSRPPSGSESWIRTLSKSSASRTASHTEVSIASVDIVCGSCEETCSSCSRPV